MAQHKVVEVRAVGRVPEAVTQDIQALLDEWQGQGWNLLTVQPVIYNSSTTGYLLLFFQKLDGAADGNGSAHASLENAEAGSRRGADRNG
ncbi:MAG: hypothetical protein J2P58_01360 [Acidimicrobiaceae bacterium]|nr:hypothetical protein [Acidimicrobiaceae bacterium]